MLSLSLSHTHTHIHTPIIRFKVFLSGSSYFILEFIEFVLSDLYQDETVSLLMILSVNSRSQ